MLHIIELIIFTVGIVASSVGIAHLGFNAFEKFSEARKRKREHENRVLTLLESINQKLTQKP